MAAKAGRPLLNIEVVYSDPTEHRRRVETRQANSATHAGQWQPPTWAKAQAGAHEYQTWASSRMVLDTTTGTPDALFSVLLARLEK